MFVFSKNMKMVNFANIVIRLIFQNASKIY